MGTAFIYATPCNHPLYEIATGKVTTLIQPKAIPKKLLDGVHEITHEYRLQSRANERRHWAAKARLTKQERGLGWQLAGTLLGQTPPFLPLKITLTRIAPRKLDKDDNLPMAWKAIKDGICDYLGVDDRTKGIVWVYAQRKPSQPRTYHIKITFEPIEEHTE